MHRRRQEDQTYRHWCEEVVGVIQGRKPFSTVDGGMGLAPVEAQESDLICILFGVPVPCVLRRVEDRAHSYLFIGSCYPNGMMADDAIEKLRSRCRPGGATADELEEDFILV
jgi:hypothetical protein